MSVLDRRMEFHLTPMRFFSRLSNNLRVPTPSKCDFRQLRATDRPRVDPEETKSLLSYGFCIRKVEIPEDI